jgi:hypothetical protein
VGVEFTLTKAESERSGMKNISRYSYPTVRRVEADTSLVKKTSNLNVSRSFNELANLKQFIAFRQTTASARTQR